VEAIVRRQVRKRSKTRSKQKNIKKDKRPDEKKPGGTDYIGGILSRDFEKRSKPQPNETQTDTPPEQTTTDTNQE